MWTAIFNAVQQLATTFIVLFGAAEKLAKAADNVATVIEQSSGLYADEAAFNRQAKELALQAKKAAAALPAPAAVVTP